MDITLPPTAIEAETDAVSFLAEKSGLPKARIKDAMTKGAVWIVPADSKRQRRLRRATQMLLPGDQVSMHYDAAILATRPETPTLIDDAGDYSVWIKPAGLMSGGTRFGDHCAIDRVVSKHLDRPAMLVHRLDRFVWGVTVLAHSKGAAANLSKQFQERSTKKIYRALVHGNLSSVQTINTPVEEKDAESIVRPLETRDSLSLVEIEILTGRKHQIRVHLNNVGHTIVGDRLHGSEDPGGIKLAATELQFKTPGTEETVHYRLPEALLPTLP